MENIKVGIKFRPLLAKDSNKEIKWTANGDKITSTDQKHKLSCGKLFDQEFIKINYIEIKIKILD